jgi:hypothetical protein
MAFDVNIGEIPENLKPPVILAPQNDWKVTNYAFLLDFPI